MHPDEMEQPTKGAVKKRRLMNATLVKNGFNEVLAILQAVDVFSTISGCPDDSSTLSERIQQNSIYQAHRKLDGIRNTFNDFIDHVIEESQPKK